MRQNEKNRHKNRPCKRAFRISPLLYNLDVDEHISNDVNFKYYSPVEFSKNKQIKANPQRDYYSVLYSLISKIGLHRATHCCDEPVLKPIDGHLETTTQSTVFVSKSYFETSEIGLECSQYVSFDNSKHKYY